MQLDLPFNPVFYRWLLNQESYLSGSDLVQLDPVLARTFKALSRVAGEKRRVDQDASLSPAQRQAALQALTLDGCPISDLGLDFTLPGSTPIELRKGGKDIPVTIHNLEQYLKVNTYEGKVGFLLHCITITFDSSSCSPIGSWWRVFPGRWSPCGKALNPSFHFSTCPFSSRKRWTSCFAVLPRYERIPRLV